MAFQMVAWYSPSNLPSSDAFLSPLSTQLIQRLLLVGWDVEKTVFLTIPFVATSSVNSGVARDYSRRVYYRTLVVTEGVIEALSDAELKIIADHEKYEMRYIEDQIRSGLYRGVVKVAEEEVRHEPLIRMLYEKYGEESVKGALSRPFEIESIRSITHIPRLVLSFWLPVHVMRNHKRYSTYAIEMPSAMLQKDQIDLLVKQWALALDCYRDWNAPMKEFLELVNSLPSQT